MGPAIFTEQARAFWSVLESAGDQEYEALLCQGETVPSHLYSEASAALARIHPGLFLVVGRSGVHLNITISANGNPALFSLAARVAEAAPLSLRERFVIHTLRQGRGFRSVLRFGVSRIDPNRIHYVSSPTMDDRLDLCIYLPEFKGVRDETSAIKAGSVYLLLDHALGEETVATAFRRVDFQDRSKQPPRARTLTALAQEIGERASCGQLGH